MTKLRISNHRLSIETGRYTGLPIKSRVCNACASVEDEEHFLITCKINQDERLIMFKTIEENCKNFRQMSTKEKMVYMLMNSDVKITQDTASL